MRDIGKLLQDADPLAREPGLSAAEVQAMRRRVLAEASAPSTVTAWWPRPALVAATIALTALAGAAVGTRLPLREPQPVVAAVDHVHQLQFATPGGTRIIWVFNQEFNP